MGERSRRWRFWRQAAVALALGLAVPQGAGADPLLDQPYFIVMFGDTPMLIERRMMPNDWPAITGQQRHGGRDGWEGPTTPGSVVRPRSPKGFMFHLPLVPDDPREAEVCLTNTLLPAFFAQATVQSTSLALYKYQIAALRVSEFAGLGLVYQNSDLSERAFFFINPKTVGRDGYSASVRFKNIERINPRAQWSSRMTYRPTASLAFTVSYSFPDCIFNFTEAQMLRLQREISRRIGLAERLLATPPL